MARTSDLERSRTEAWCFFDANCMHLRSSCGHRGSILAFIDILTYTDAFCRLSGLDRGLGRRLRPSGRTCMGPHDGKDMSYSELLGILPATHLLSQRRAIFAAVFLLLR